MEDCLPRLRIDLRIASDFRLTDMVHTVLENVCEGLGMDKETTHWFILAAREAVNNSIRHGYQGEPDKEVRIVLKTQARNLVVQVKDQGPGFDPEELPDPTRPENLMKTNGRGVFFMHRFSDGVKAYRHKGWFIVELSRQIPASQAS